MPEKSKRISIPKEVREYVFHRDNHQCQSCGQTAKLSIDHIIPLAWIIHDDFWKSSKCILKDNSGDQARKQCVF